MQGFNKSAPQTAVFIVNTKVASVGTPGGLKAAYDYRSFGEQVTLAETADKVTENFTGKERDDETELNYFGARYLDPMLGVWTSVDPKRQFASPYLYAGNGVNPINVVDPDGNEYWDDFNSPRAARDDFKKIYITKSINENVEYATMFYETKRIGKDGKIASTYSYTKPNRGTIDRVVLDPNCLKMYMTKNIREELSKLHTHCLMAMLVRIHVVMMAMIGRTHRRWTWII